MLLSKPFAVVTPTLDGDVLTVLARADAAFTAGQVHRVLGHHSQDGVRRVLHRLTAQGVVTEERVGHAGVYRFNREHLAATYILGLAQLREELVSRIRAHVATWAVAPDLLIIFGSAARGDMVATSDIDLLVVRPRGVERSARWEADTAALGEQVTNWTGNDARVLELAADEVAATLDREPVLQAARDEGIVVVGDPRYLRRSPAGKA